MNKLQSQLPDALIAQLTWYLGNDGATALQAHVDAVHLKVTSSQMYLEELGDIIAAARAVPPVIEQLPAESIVSGQA